jgi:hypothetical protein
MASLALFLAAAAGSAGAAEGPIPAGVPELNHVFLIMMENHAYSQIVNNPNAPFTNSLMANSNVANNYFAVAHPSLTNYLEVVGGSNFGVLDDNSPDWHNAACTPNIVSGVTSFESTATAICPIAFVGVDAVTPAIDYTNETTGPPGDININGTLSIPPAPTVGKSIADQLVAAGMSWKSYQESLPPTGADGVNNADGFFSNLTNWSTTAALQNTNLVALYAVKHNPFAYFADVQAGLNPKNSLNNMADFEGARGLFADLASGNVPDFAFIAPNQCNDQHGRGNAGPVCDYDPNDNGTQVGLNPGLIYQGDATLRHLVTAIKSSPAWSRGNNAIVIIWDENDYSIAPTTNQVLAIVDTSYSAGGVQSKRFYTHFSLLKTIEAGFGLPCLNHACDPNVQVMSDLFQGGFGGK